MPVCPNCGMKVKWDDFCSHCGAPLKPGAAKPAGTGAAPAAAGAPPIAPALALGALGVVLIGLLAVGVIAGIVVVIALITQNPTNVPTTLQISVSNQTVANSSTSVKVLLTAYGNQPVTNRTITIYDDVPVNVTTGSDGTATVTISFPAYGNKKIRAYFEGDKTYLNSTYEKYVFVTPASCNDGTYVGQCSDYSSGYFCHQNKSLGYNCSECGCTGSLVCYDNYCVTEETKTALIIDYLQETVVYVENSYASGSGVIIAQDEENSLTAVLTNHHVVEDAESVEDVRVTFRDGQTIPASRVLVAPHDMDLAVVFVLGLHGTPAPFNASQPYYQGMEVIALGSPLGIQGSVSKGIISNIVSTTTDTGYSYTAIQTDAAINPGNSGGGLFLQSNGNLVGINTFVLASEYGAEGLGFAISEDSLSTLPQMQYWSDFEPTNRCSDKTPYDKCSAKTPGAYCSNGNLVNKCSYCGCATGYGCALNDKCIYCPNGVVYSDQYNAICCPYGTKGYYDYWGDIVCQ